MQHNREKQQSMLDNPELVLCENGDFRIKAELVDNYEIIDMHCHIFRGLSQLFPGLTADHTMFESQVDYFGEKYNLIVWDAPCHGKSRSYEKLDLEDSTNVIIKIMEENKVENIICVGQSFGGYHIQAMIARYPEKVKTFVGIGTSPYGEIYYSKSDLFWLKQVEWMGMCYPINPLKRAAAKGATRTETGYKNMREMIAPYRKREYCHMMLFCRIIRI